MPVERIGSASIHAADKLEDPEFQLDEAAVESILKGVLDGAMDVRSAIPNISDDSDEDQRRAILLDAPIIRLLAPAGSGKTQTVANRIVRLLKQGISSEAILTLTFDNASSSALRGKLQKLGVAHQPSTLNALSYRLLRSYWPALHKPIAESRDQTVAYRTAKKSLTDLPELEKLWPDNLKDRVFRDFFSVMKNNCIDPRDKDAQPAANFIIGSAVAKQAFFSKVQSQSDISKIVSFLIRCFRAFDRELQSINKMDFDDQKLRCYVALKTDGPIASRIASQYRHVIVDEFQDINKLDLELIRLLAADSNLLVTGDDDQAIYGFRGCSPHYILNLEAVLGKPVAQVELRRNYRCPRNIVVHADKLIRNNQNRAEKQPIAARDDDAAIKVVSSTTAGIEARTAVRFIRKMVENKKAVRYDDCAILYRTNAQCLPLQLHLLLEGVPYFVKDEHNILMNQQLRVLLGVLRVKQAVVARREPDLSDVLCLPPAHFSYWKPEDRDRLQRYLSSHNPLLDGLMSVGPSVSSKISGGNFKANVRAMLGAQGLTATLRALAETFKGLRGMVGSLEEVVENAAPFGEIFELAASYRGRLDDFVSALEQALAADQYAKQDERGRVALTTYFGAKGLQWHTVVMTGCNTGLIPHARGDLEEERRLFYVAMTRASANLYLSYLAKSCGHAVSPSGFLFEAGLMEQAKD